MIDLEIDAPIWFSLDAVAELAQKIVEALEPELDWCVMADYSGKNKVRIRIMSVA